MTDAGARLAAVHDATTRYLQDVDGLTSTELAGPSGLPGWTRAHVAAHVAQHALGTARALEGLVRDRAVPVYDSMPQRDADIESVAGRGADELRELSFAACSRWAKAIEAALGHAGTVERTPGGPRWTVDDTIEARWREVEIHHADLDCGYGPHDWPDPFLDTVFNTVVEDRHSQPMLLRTPDGDVLVGSGYGATVTGDRADLAWWLLGRGRGDGLTSDGPLPTLGPWTRRTPAK